MRKRIVQWGLVGLLAWSLAGCSSSDSPTQPGSHNHSSTPPALPSVSTMKPALDFYGVQLPTLDPQTIATGKPSGALRSSAGDHSNWINGYVRAIFIMLTTYDLLDKPVGAFAIAMHSVPQKQDDGSYLWTYIFKNGDIEYSVFLYGTPGDHTVAWRMEVSSNNPDQPLDHFVWFTGESQRDDSSGYWQFYAPVDETNGVETIRVDWTHSDRHETRLKLTVNGSGLENEGDTLTITEGQDASAIELLDASAGLTSSIIWRRDGSGSVTVPDYNGGAMACWDQHQMNVACQ